MWDVGFGVWVCLGCITAIGEVGFGVCGLPFAARNGSSPFAARRLSLLVFRVQGSGFLGWGTNPSTCKTLVLLLRQHAVEPTQVELASEGFAREGEAGVSRGFRVLGFTGFGFRVSVLGVRGSQFQNNYFAEM